MLNQTFTFSDIPQVFTLAFLEMLLSADNAVVLGVLSHSLPIPLRRRALYVGLASAFVFRLGALLGVALVFKSTWVQLFGSAYLIYLTIRYLVKKGKSVEVKPIRSFWKVVLLIELLDLVFAIDSIVAGLAFINDAMSKLWIVYIGGMIGILGMRYAADLFSKFIDRFPRLERSAYFMVGWIGIKLGFSAFDKDLPSPLFWIVIALLFLFGFYRRELKHE